MFKNVMIAAVGATFVFATSAHALATCSDSDITPNALDCSGFYSGNLLNGSPGGIAAQEAGLAAIGFTWDGNFGSVEKISSLGGSHTVDFTTLLAGISYVGIHFGNGTGGPGNGTAFYKIDAGAGLDTFTLAYNASSDAVLYSTGTPTGGVPEPATWAMMIMGFGAIGVVLRRRTLAAAA